MGIETPIRVEEYLTTTYRPDCDYVDGVLEDRNVGEKDHAKVQKRLLLHLAALEKDLKVFVVQEQRIQVTPVRYRVVDTCVVLGGEPDEQILTHPPFLCIEVLSPEDRMIRMQARIDDYLGFGVRYVWIVDPRAKRAWVVTTDGQVPVRDRVLRTAAPEIAVPLAALFE